MNPKPPALDQVTALCRSALPDRSRLAVEAIEPLAHYQHELYTVTLRWGGSVLLWTPPQRETLALRLYRSPLSWWSTDDSAKATRELALNPRLRAADLPAPTVVAAGVDSTLGQYLLMTLATGRGWFSPEIDHRAVLTPLIQPYAELLATLHRVSGVGDWVSGVGDKGREGGELDRLPPSLPVVRLAAILAWYRGLAEAAGEAAVVAMADRLIEFSAGRVELEPVLIHGSPDFGNLLVENGVITAWLDWEDVAIADPRWDVAAVVAYLRIFKLADLGQRFVDAYQTASGRRIDDLTFWLAVIALRGWALTVWLKAQHAAGAAPAIPGLDHWLHALPRYQSTAQQAQQRAEGWWRLQQQRGAG